MKGVKRKIRPLDIHGVVALIFFFFSVERKACIVQLTAHNFFFSCYALLTCTFIFNSSEVAFSDAIHLSFLLVSRVSGSLMMGAFFFFLS